MGFLIQNRVRRTVVQALVVAAFVVPGSRAVDVLPSPGVVGGQPVSSAADAGRGVCFLPLSLRKAWPAYPPTPIQGPLPANPTPGSPIPMPPSDVYANCKVRLERDNGVDGTIDELETRSYGSASNLVRDMRDSDADGVADYLRWLRYSSGGLLELVLVDDGYDGSIDQTISYTYMAGRLYRRAVALDGLPQYVWYYEYDSHGNMVRRSKDSGADGDIDSVHRYEYDDRGRRTRTEEDWGNDGVVDRSVSYSWLGAVLIRTDNDFGNDGSVEQSFVYSYDDGGRLVRLEVADESGNESLAGTYEYDELYRVVVKLSHHGAETWTDRTIFSYDAADRVVEQRWESRTFYPPYVVNHYNDCPQLLKARTPSLRHEEGNGSDSLHR